MIKFDDGLEHVLLLSQDIIIITPRN